VVKITPEWVSSSGNTKGTWIGGLTREGNLTIAEGQTIRLFCPKRNESSSRQKSVRASGRAFEDVASGIPVEGGREEVKGDGDQGAGDVRGSALLPDGTFRVETPADCWQALAFRTIEHGERGGTSSSPTGDPRGGAGEAAAGAERSLREGRRSRERSSLQKFVPADLGGIQASSPSRDRLGT
jgi:hypothetical protein